MAQDSLLPAYLVVGEDELKRTKTLDRLRKRLDESGMAAFNLDERQMDREQEIDDIVASLNTLPMGAPFRLVILFSCDKLPKYLSDPLVDYLANPSPTTVCLFVAEKLSKASRLYKAIEKIDKKSIIDCSPKKGRELPQYLVKQAKAYGMSMSYDAAQELVNYVGDNSRMLDNELKRLAQLLPGVPITPHVIEQNVARTAEAKPWGFLDAVSARNLPKALELLALQPKNSEVYLLTLLTDRIRELIVAKCLDRRGAGRELASTISSLRSNPGERNKDGSARKPRKVEAWQVKNHLRWAQAFSMEELLSALDTAAETELALKGSPDSALALRMWLINVLRR